MLTYLTCEADRLTLFVIYVTYLGNSTYARVFRDRNYSPPVIYIYGL